MCGGIATLAASIKQNCGKLPKKNVQDELLLELHLDSGARFSGGGGMLSMPASQLTQLGEAGSRQRVVARQSFVIQ